MYGRYKKMLGRIGIRLDYRTRREASVFLRSERLAFPDTTKGRSIGRRERGFGELRKSVFPELFGMNRDG